MEFRKGATINACRAARALKEECTICAGVGLPEKTQKVKSQMPHGLRRRTGALEIYKTKVWKI